MKDADERLNRAKISPSTPPVTGDTSSLCHPQGSVKQIEWRRTLTDFSSISTRRLDLYAQPSSVGIFVGEDIVADQADAQAMWLPVIGRALAYICLLEAQRKEPEKFDSVLKRVKFLEDLGLSRDHAAEAAGSSLASVRELHRRTKSRKEKNGRAKKKSTG
jgi:hypothetical protein